MENTDQNKHKKKIYHPKKSKKFSRWRHNEFFQIG